MWPECFLLEDMAQVGGSKSSSLTQKYQILIWARSVRISFRQFWQNEKHLECKTTWLTTFSYCKLNYRVVEWELIKKKSCLKNVWLNGALNWEQLCHLSQSLLMKFDLLVTSFKVLTWMNGWWSSMLTTGGNKHGKRRFLLGSMDQEDVGLPRLHQLDGGR